MDFPDDPAALLNNGQFTDGDPQQGLEASRILASWMNAVTNELINFIAVSGITPNVADHTQLTYALQNYFNLVDAANANNLGNNPPEYYRDAANLNAGILPGARFNDTAHGYRGGGGLHETADENQDGFMSWQDYTLLEHMRYDTLALQSLSSWAWRLLPAGGVIINGGRLLSGGVSDDQTRSMTFHTAFPNWCLTVLVAPVHADAPSGYTYPTVIAFSQTGFTVKMRGPYPADWGFHFIAIGY